MLSPFSACIFLIKSNTVKAIGLRVEVIEAEAKVFCDSYHYDIAVDPMDNGESYMALKDSFIYNTKRRFS